MLYVPLILGSTRRGRQSPKVARYLLRRLEATGRAKSELIDLLELDLPIMEERLRMRDDPPPGLAEFGAKIGRADGLLVVTPEYNHGYPGVLKNALDYLLPEYRRKPFAIATVSRGAFGGVNCLEQLRLVSLGMGGFPVPASFPVVKVEESFSDDGTPADPATDKRADAFLEELLWFAEAVADKKAKDAAAGGRG